MSFQERQTWVEAVVTILVPGWYFVSILSQAAGTPVSDIEYQWPLALSVVVSIVVIIATTIASVIASQISAAIERGSAEGLPAPVVEVDRSDERDAAINRFGSYVGYIVLGVAILLPLGLAMTEREPFWIANALFAALVLSALASGAARLIAYRRGL